MQTTLELEQKMRIKAFDSRNHITYFDSYPGVGGEDSAPTPMEVMLQAMAACSFMDVVSILRKKRKTIDQLRIKVDSDRAEMHPKVFTRVHLIYELTSPDAEIKDLERAIELSQQTYCGASAMFKRAGCVVTWEANLINTNQ